MRSLVSLLLALLFASPVATASTAVWRDGAGRAVVVHEAPGAASLSETASLLPEETVRVPLRAAAGMVLRAMGPLPFGRTTAIAVMHADSDALSVSWRAAQSARGLEVHRLASGGSVLPYFPTAPPRRA